MKKLIIALCCLAITGNICGETILPGGYVTGNLSQAGSPYLVYGDLTVQCQKTLYIEDGVTLIFKGDYSLDVYGCLKANGTEDSPILFTHEEGQGYWKGLRIFGESFCQDNLGSYLHHVIIEYANSSGGEELWENSGGGLFISNDENVELRNCIFRYNSAVGGDPGVSLGGGALAIENCSPSIKDCQFIENVCNKFGGAISLSGASPLIDRTVIMDNSAGMLLVGGGAGIFMQNGCFPTLTNTTLLNNLTNGKGGGVYLSEDSDPVFINSLIWGNDAISGKQVYLEGNCCDPCFEYSDVMENVAGFDGPGSGFCYTGSYTNNIDIEPMCFHSSGSPYPYELTMCSPLIDAGNPDEEYFDLDGTISDIGAMHYAHEGMYIQKPKLSGLWDDARSPVWVNIDVEIPEDGQLVIDPGVEVIFTKDHSFTVKGSLKAAGEFDNKIRFRPYDRSLRWSGIRFMPQTGRSERSQLIYCLISGANPKGQEQADNMGGGILIFGRDNVLVSYCQIFNNCCGSLTGVYTGGGGIGIINASPTLIHNSITGNHAPDFGGGIAMVDANPVMHHNLIAGNSAGKGGGALSISDSDPVISNLTIAHNEGGRLGGGLLISEDADPVIYNSILWGNSAEYGNQVYINDNKSDPDFYYNDIAEGKEGISGAGILSYQGTFENNIDADPWFNNAGYGLHHGSPCINTGDPGSRPDPDGTRADMGAFYYRTMDKDVDALLVDESSDLIFSVFPVPAKDKINLTGESNSEGYVQFELYNSLGQMVKKGIYNSDDASGFNIEIDVSKCQAGNYILVVKTGRSIESRKVIIN